MHSGPFKVIRCCDPAIEDPVGTDALKYSTTRDVSLLKFIPDTKPTVFHCRHLTISERRQVRNQASDADRYEAAFVRGLVSVTDLVRDDSGARIQWSRPTDHSGKDKPIPDKILEECFDEATIQEIGMVIYSRSFLERTSGQYYPLPAICRDALSATVVERARRLAEQMNASSSSAPSSQPAAASTPTPPTSSPAGAASTDATAMV